MHTFIRFSALLVLSVAIAAPAMAEIYKRTNPDGSVEFTDVPRSDDEKPVPLSPMSTFKTTPVPQQKRTSTARADAKKYSVISVTSPANETTIRDNTGMVTVNVSLSPALRSGHKLVLLVDGEQKGESRSGSFTLNNLDRGSHSLVAQVVDKAGKALISSAPVTIYLFRQSVIRSNRAR
ncbi:MAG: DUF4124 domain-containing protein [Gammaproteobacteria bacterium]|nr:DUF4124 domain-containing protein [Gammaproteobacteria bacterium]